MIDKLSEADKKASERITRECKAGLRISAGELRAMGGKIPNNVPDCATVRRSAVRFGNVHLPTEIDEAFKRGMLRATVKMHLDEPFEWYAFDVTLAGGVASKTYKKSSTRNGTKTDDPNRGE